MNPKNEREAMLRALCAGEHPGDGVDPKEERRQDLKREMKEQRLKVAWKDEQAGRRAFRELAGEVASIPGMHALGAELVSVRSEDGGKTLRAVVAFDGPAEREKDVLARLGGARGVLRAAVARVIRRKRVPELAFAAVPWGAVRDRDEGDRVESVGGEGEEAEGNGAEGGDA